MRGCGCWGLLLSIGLIWGGGQGIYEGLKNRRPQTMTFQQFEQSKPTGGWFKITKCELSVPEAMWMEQFGSMDEVFVPVRMAGDATENKPISLLLQVNDPKIRETVTKIKELDEQSKGSEAKVLEWVLTHHDEVYVQRDIEGMLAFGINDLKSSERDKIKALNPELAPDFVVLKEGEKPGLLVGFAMLGGGLLLLLFVLIGGKSTSENSGVAKGNGEADAGIQPEAKPESNDSSNPPSAPSPWNGPGAA
jgi:hypothetical protein